MSDNIRIKALPNRWLTFCILVFSGGVAFKVISMKDMFYIPMQEFMGLTHAQIGGAMSAYGIVQTIGLVVGIYICDRFSKKYMISFSLIGIGIVGAYVSTFPPYWGFLLAFAVMSILGEVTYWPVLLKAVRLTGTEKDQGRMFGFLEMGRGVVDVIVASTAVWLFSVMGEGSFALRMGILFLAGVTASAGVLCYFFIPHDVINRKNKEGKEVSKNVVAFEGMMEAVKSIEIWAVAFNGFMVYCVYCGLTYFIPFLGEIYSMPVVYVGMYGIVNQYALKMVGGPVGGLISDKVTHSAAKYIRIAFVVAAVAMIGFLLLPHDILGASGNYMVGVVLTLSFGAIIFTMRAVFFAPMDEIRVRPEITGAAMSLACLIIYLPNSFAYLLYGSILDANPGLTGYRIVFGIMAAFAAGGFFVSSYLIMLIKRKQSLPKEINQ